MDIAIICYAMEGDHRIPGGEIDDLKLYNWLGDHEYHLNFQIHLSS
jgi:hypothetical protein